MSDVSTQVPHSPKWKRPGDVMKKIYLRKKKIPTRSASLSLANQLNGVINDAKSSEKNSKNPFAKKRFSSDSAKQDKKRVLSVHDVAANNLNEIQNDNFNGSSVFDSYDDDSNESENNSLDFVYLNEDSFLGIVNVNGVNDNFAAFRKDALPIDWTLKSKARFLSSSSFSWCARIKGAEEADAISRASRCLEKEKLPSNYRVELGKNLVYWQHPYIPWLTLFPRFGPECGFVAASSDEPVLSESARSSLYDSWVIAFRSVYQLLRQNLCPFFYVCSQQYTALFRCASVTQAEVHCLLTPTSLGFRKALKSQGITFSTPMQRRTDPDVNAAAPPDSCNDMAVRNLDKDNSLCHPSPIGDENKENKNDSNCDEAADDSSQEDADSDEEQEWKNISENLSFRKSRKLITAASEDGLPNTAVFVEGLANTQLLFNYLLNSRSSISISGRQTGMPPTILAPVSFNGATLRKLESRAGIAKIRSNSSQTTSRLSSSNVSTQHFSLDISGPIMPHHLNGIFSLLDNTQERGDYSASFGTYINTAPFNTSHRDADARKSVSCKSEIDVVSCDQDFAKKFLQNFNFDAPPVSMRKMNALNRTFEWEV